MIERFSFESKLSETGFWISYVTDPSQPRRGAAQEIPHTSHTRRMRTVNEKESSRSKMRLGMRTKLVLLALVPFSSAFVLPSRRQRNRHNTVLFADRVSRNEALKQEIQAQLEEAKDQRLAMEQEIEQFELQIEVDKQKLGEMDDEVVKLLDRLAKVEKASAAAASATTILGGSSLVPAVGLPVFALLAGRRALERRQAVLEEKKRIEEQKAKTSAKSTTSGFIVRTTVRPLPLCSGTVLKR